MFKKVNEDLKVCKEKIILKEILERHLVALEIILKSEELELEKLEKSLDKEYKDVEKMEGISIKSIFATFTGSKEDKLFTEQQEYIQVKLKYEEIVWTIKEYRNNLMDLKVRILELSKCEEEYKKLIKQKSEIIKSTEVEDSIKHELKEEEYNQYCKIKQGVEIKQAIAACKDCLEIIYTNNESLSSARTLNYFDMASDEVASTLADFEKYERINESRSQLFALTHYIGRLNEELGDIKMLFTFNGYNYNTLIDELEIDAETYRNDVLGDNGFTELSVSSLIKNALENTKDIENQLINLQGVLAEKENQINEEINVINKRLDELIEKAN